MKKSFLFLLLLMTFCLVGCKKEYTVEIERIEVWRGDVKRVTKDYEKKTFKAKDDEEAANEAYRKYLINMKICCDSEKRNSEFLWIPIDYTITDSKGNNIPQNLYGLKESPRPEFLIVGEQEDSIYYALLGYFKFVGTPYGIRNPKPSPF